MPTIKTATVKYQLASGFTQTRRVKYFGDGGVAENIEQITAILAENHDLPPEQVTLLTGAAPADEAESEADAPQTPAPAPAQQAPNQAAPKPADIPAPAPAPVAKPTAALEPIAPAPAPVQTADTGETATGDLAEFGTT